jgi:hypothetical protein
MSRIALKRSLGSGLLSGTCDINGIWSKSATMRNESCEERGGRGSGKVKQESQMKLE